MIFFHPCCDNDPIMILAYSGVVYPFCDSPTLVNDDDNDDGGGVDDHDHHDDVHPFCDRPTLINVDQVENLPDVFLCHLSPPS